MRRPVKIALWTVVFVACAVAGAIVASRTDPFPPGVEDPGGRPSTSSSSPSVPPTSIEVSIGAATRHELHVGGTCTSDWEIRLEVEVAADAAATGTGEATVLEGAGCPFGAGGQVQARRIGLTARGHREGETLLLALNEDGGRTPAGAIDLGGLVETLPRLRLALEVDGAREVVVVERPDGNLGRYVARYRAGATCVSGC
ncbi:MAG TPA: hypothetical protein VF235_01275 [Actinomycetota bacterium]